VLAWVSTVGSVVGAVAEKGSCVTVEPDSVGSEGGVSSAFVSRVDMEGVISETEVCWESRGSEVGPGGRGEVAMSVLSASSGMGEEATPGAVTEVKIVVVISAGIEVVAVAADVRDVVGAVESPSEGTRSRDTGVGKVRAGTIEAEVCEKEGSGVRTRVSCLNLSKNMTKQRAVFRSLLCKECMQETLLRAQLVRPKKHETRHD